MANSASTKKAAPETASESMYTAAELANNHTIFNTSYEIVSVALHLAGKKEATLAEAKEIVEKFKTKEVK